VTGAVITSAGNRRVFLVLGVLPLVFLTEIGVVVVFGVVLDTLVVRSLLVPALTFELGSRIWWPARLGPAPAVRSATAPADSDPAPTG
jgi:RND superfamily putative drug exporter